ncbi:MAG: aminotransferase class I/II-fold pyridoxal phosphate-dependent enzyme [Gammaproteobacteria bacterium]|jgi:aspartate aminotransferase|nr:aminotransferase class I/II-fold pyridoxal phosphate-dependent enzyme [Gammaproteobacteria bacterium]
MTELQLAQRVRDVDASPTASLNARTAELRAAGHEIIGMGTGELDFDTPAHIKAAAKAAIDQGLTRYTAVDGIPELKKAIVAKLDRENGLQYETSQILVSCGCKQALYNLVQAAINEGDEVIVPAPYWVSYPEMVKLAGGTPVIVSAGIEEGFKLRPERLQAAITDKTRLLFVNSPCNPTGAVYSLQELKDLGDVIRANPKVMVASDDIYEHLLWGEDSFANIINACPELYERTFVLNGVSKAYAMTGWRIGFAAGPERLIKKMKAIQSQSTSNPTSIAQYAALAALEGDQSFPAHAVDVLKQRHDFVYHRLEQIEAVRCLPSQGTFYLFADVRDMMKRLGATTDIELSELLIERAGVAVVPGSAFGAPGHVRISFATNMEDLDKAMTGLAEVIG